MKQYRIKVSGNAPYDYPTEIFFGLLFYGEKEKDVIAIAESYPFRGEWGKTKESQIRNRDSFPMPHKLEIVWLSILEKRFYDLDTELPVSKLELLWNGGSQNTDSPFYDSIIVGMAPNGFIALWFWSDKKSINVGWFKANETSVSMEAFIPNHKELTVESYCEYYMESLGCLQKDRIKISEFGTRMKQFTYRYVTLFEKWIEDEEKWGKYTDDDLLPEFNYIEEALYDGTHDKLHDGGLMKYHNAGKPMKLALRWHIKKSEYVAYFWFDEDEIRTVFDRFYGMHPDTKTDFIIRIDPEKRKYELALYRYGLKEPQIVLKSAYQLLVFKNQFEDFRSDNYSKEHGAWIW